MCRIDAPFGNLTLEEKKDPEDRFIQVLDEYGVEGNFREMLIKHFSQDWTDKHWKNAIFRNAGELENALIEANKCSSDIEKYIAVIESQRHLILSKLLTETGTYALEEFPKFLSFLKDISNSYYPNKPYAFYFSGMEVIKLLSYVSFVSSLYSEDFCFSEAFFNDISLCEIDNDKRDAFLCECLYSLSPSLRALLSDYFDPRELQELEVIASPDFNSRHASSKSLQILRGIDFINAWVKFDSKAGRISYSEIDFLYNSKNTPWYKFFELYSSGQVSDSVTKWIEKKSNFFLEILYTNADLNNISSEEIEKWCSGIDRYFTECTQPIYINNDPTQLGSTTLYKDIHLIQDQICQQLQPIQLDAWISYSVESDFDRILSSGSNCNCFSQSRVKWLREKYFSNWKKAFLEKINTLSIKEQLCILSSQFILVDIHSNEFQDQFYGWWNSLIDGLIENENFPKDLTPEWTVEAIRRYWGDREQFLPYIEKSVGILRSYIKQHESSDDEIKEYHNLLKSLLDSLDELRPEKSLRHRLFLMRSSPIPYSNQSLHRETSFNYKDFRLWYKPLQKLAKFTYFVPMSQLESEKIENKALIAITNELAEFCISRLRLRKGEKATNGKYESNQVIEQSPIWRQGYLKVLIELGFDLNGQVHKTVNFIKKADPEEGVRDIASECYKVVRRKAKKNPENIDLKRAIVAAEWWLFLCQRQALELDIDYNGALKTRRNLMRNP